MSGNTRAIIINTPSNPSGKVWSRAELERIAAFCDKHDLTVFTDEIYEHFVFDGLEHVSFASLPGMWERTITISGLSKTFSITGWRIGYSVCPQHWAEAIGNFSDLVYVCAPTPLQLGAAAGLMQLDDRYFRQLAAKYQAKRERLCNALADAGLTPCVPQGAYYVLADVSSLFCFAKEDDVIEDACRRLQALAVKAAASV
jgi:aminotransferase